MEKKGSDEWQAGLTPREFEVLRLVAQGFTNEEIAGELYLSVKTIEKILGRKGASQAIYRKIGVKNRSEAAAWYTEVTTIYRLSQIYSPDFLQFIYQARMNGNPILAIAWAIHCANRLRDEINMHMRSPKLRESLLRYLGRIRYEQLIAHFEICLPHKLWAVAEPIIREIRSIARECKDKEMMGLADYAQGTADYLVGNRTKAVRAFNRAQESPTTDTVNLKILRALALNWAYLKEEQKFKEVEAQAMDIIARGNDLHRHNVCMALEGLGRGQGILAMASAFTTLEEGWDMYTKAKNDDQKIPIRYIQLARSELECMQYLQSPDKHILQTRSTEGLRLAREYGYQRYERHIQNLLEQLI